MGMKVTSTITNLGTQHGRASRGSSHGAAPGESMTDRDSARKTELRRDYGHGLPPPGPSNYLVSTPNFLPFERDDDSQQGE